MKEACEWGGICRGTLYKLLNAGSIDAVRLGRRTLVSIESLSRHYESLPRFKQEMTNEKTKSKKAD